MVLNCSVDVLAYDFSICKITVTRNENAGINLIPDSKFPVLPNEVDKEYITVFNDDIADSGLQGYNYILCTISGGVSNGCE